QQRVTLLLLKVGQRERGVLVEFDVLAVEQERLAGGALPFLAAVHQHDALLEGGAQDRLLLADLDLDADGLEAHHVLIAHDSLGWLRADLTRWPRRAARMAPPAPPPGRA